MARKPVVDPVSSFLLGFGAGGTVMHLLDPSTLVARILLACCVIAGAAASILRLVRRDAAGRRTWSVAKAFKNLANRRR